MCGSALLHAQRYLSSPGSSLLFDNIPALESVVFPVHIRTEAEQQDEYATIPPGVQPDAVIPMLCNEIAAPISGEAGAASCVTALTAQWPELHRRKCYTNVNRTDVSHRPKLHQCVVFVCLLHVEPDGSANMALLAH